MVPMEVFALEHEGGDDGKDGEGDDLLYGLELGRGEMAVAYAVGRNLQHVFEERQPPAREDEVGRAHV